MVEKLASFSEVLQAQFLNNTVRDYLTAALILIGVVFLLMLFRQVAVGRLRVLAQKTRNDFDDLLVELLGQIGPSCYIVIALYISTLSLELDEALRALVRYALVIVVSIRAVLILQRLSAYGVEKFYRKTKSDDPTAATAIRNINTVIKWGLWALALVFVLDNLGINISAVVAGLGIGGIAVALAAQAVLGDAFSAISIFFDKPFQVGDFVIVGDLLGSVEHVGLKTTRIRSLHGEQLVFSNSDLTSSRIRNYKRMEVRRIAFKIGVVYQTSSARVRKIPDLVRAIFEKIEGVKLDRVHFLSFGDFALIYEIVYYVLSPDYNVYMDKQQETNFALKDVFEREGIEFAYPTQTLYVTQEGSKS